MKTLYVIGNGFDKYHDIQCSYSEFLSWLREKHGGLLFDMDKVYGICDGEWWKDFEHNLGEIDVMGYAQQVAFENPVDLSSDHCDAMWNDAQIEVENQMTQLYNQLQGCFEEWVAQLNSPSEGKRVYLDSHDAQFLVFNYTRTLEEMYRIPEKRILHIHGEAGKRKKLIIGHGKTMEILKREHPTPSDLYHQGKLDEEAASSFDIHDELAWDEAFRQVASMRKPVEIIMNEYVPFFNRIKDVPKICVYGLSFSDVDIPYMEKIASLSPKAHWEISCFSEIDRKKVSAFTSKNDIKDFKIVRLSELEDPNQLRIKF